AEKQRAESQSSSVSEGGDLRRIYHIFVFCSGDGRSDQGREHADCACLCRAQHSARGARCICRTGCGQRMMEKSDSSEGGYMPLTVRRRNGDFYEDRACGNVCKRSGSCKGFLYKIPGCIFQ